MNQPGLSEDCRGGFSWHDRVCRGVRANECEREIFEANTCPLSLWIVCSWRIRKKSDECLPAFKGMSDWYEVYFRSCNKCLYWHRGTDSETKPSFEQVKSRKFTVMQADRTNSIKRQYNIALFLIRPVLYPINLLFLGRRWTDICCFIAFKKTTGRIWRIGYCLCTWRLFSSSLPFPQISLDVAYMFFLIPTNEGNRGS